MAHKKYTGFKGMVFKNRWTVLSLLIILAMFVLGTSYHKQGGYKDWVQKNQGAGRGKANVGGPFTLTDFNNNPFTDANLKGVYTLMFFGYTFCPDVCPTALSTMANVYDSLDPKLTKMLNVVFISVDPKRDTPEVLKAYVPAFHPAFLGATGTPKQLADMGKKFLVYHVIHAPENPLEPNNYLVDHSAYFYLFGPDGRYVTHFRHKDTVEQIVTKLQQILYK